MYDLLGLNLNHDILQQLCDVTTVKDGGTEDGKQKQSSVGAVGKAAVLSFFSSLLSFPTTVQVMTTQISFPLTIASCLLLQHFFSFENTTVQTTQNTHPLPYWVQLWPLVNWGHYYTRPHCQYDPHFMAGTKGIMHGSTFPFTAVPFLFSSNSPRFFNGFVFILFSAILQPTDQKTS